MRLVRWIALHLFVSALIAIPGLIIIHRLDLGLLDTTALAYGDGWASAALAVRIIGKPPYPWRKRS